MLEFIKKNYQVGDPIEITTSAGIYTGQIEFINSKYIVLRQGNGKICGIAGSDIFSFKADIPAEILSGKTYWEADEETSATPVVHPVSSSPVAEAPAPVMEEDDELQPETEAPDASEVAPVSLAEPKVVGHIDLAKLQQIDPKLSSRNYFSRGEEPNVRRDAAESVAADTDDSADELDTAGEVGGQQGYIPAKGRVTYFNYEHRYGFIHDFASDADLYFRMHQIAEPMLLDRIRKGTKVVYSIDHNAQGPTANCLHLPHPVNTLFIVAENCIDSYKYYFAREILEHILEIYPDNKDALEMLDEARQSDRQAAPGGNDSAVEQYNPAVLYPQAKRAYLQKEYAEAERLYFEALEAGEKPESCIKDLMTLYVSHFKQAEEDAVKADNRDKALQLYERYQHLLADNMTNRQFLALNFYLPLGEYEKFIALVDDILMAPQVAHAVSRRVFYLWQKGLALYKLERCDEALTLVEGALELSPHSRQLQNLKQLLVNPQSDEASADQVPETPAAEPVENDAPAVDAPTDNTEASEA